jgi:hypothetical protein
MCGKGRKKSAIRMKKQREVAAGPAAGRVHQHGAKRTPQDTDGDAERGGGAP